MSELEEILNNMDKELADLFKVDMRLKSTPSLDSPSYIFIRERQITQKKKEIKQKKEEIKKSKV